MNHYDVLGVKRTASQEEIKKAYKDLVKKYHPDVYKGDKTFAEKKTAQINGAYEVLANPETRQAYDDETFPKVNYSYTPPEYTNYYDQYKDKYKNTYSYRHNENVRDGSEHDYYTYVNYGPRGTNYNRYQTQNPNYNNNPFTDKIYANVNKLSSQKQKTIFIIFILIYIILFIFSIIQFQKLMNPTSSKNSKTPDVSYSSEPETSLKNETADSFKNETSENINTYKNEITNTTIVPEQEYDLYDFFTEAELESLYLEVKPYFENEVTYEEFKKILAEYLNISY